MVIILEKKGDKRIKSTGRGSDWYGVCDQCGKKAGLIYKQQTRHGRGFTNSAFGHAECLKFGAFVDAPVVD